MTKEKTKEKARNKSLFNRFLDVVERAGNKLPHPIVLFGLFALGVVVISGLLHAMGVSAEGELINSKTGEVEHTIVTIKSLFNTNGIVYMMTNAVKNFTGFAPLGTVLVAMLGVGVAEQSGWISSLLRKTVEITPAALITPVVDLDDLNVDLDYQSMNLLKLIHKYPTLTYKEYVFLKQP